MSKLKEKLLEAFGDSRGVITVHVIDLLAIIKVECEVSGKDYLESVMRSRAKTNPNMTIKEFYEGQFEQKHNLTGAKND